MKRLGLSSTRLENQVDADRQPSRPTPHCEASEGSSGPFLEALPGNPKGPTKPVKPALRTPSGPREDMPSQEDGSSRGLATDSKRDMIDYRLCLSPSEVQELTGRIYAKSQIKALLFMGIGFTVRIDGTPAVFRSAVPSSEEGNGGAKSARRKEPRFDAL